MLAGDAEPVTGARFQHGTERPFHNPASDGWASLASFVFAGMTGAGLLVVVFGVYLTRSDLFILVGAATMSLAAMGWVAVALVMIGIIVKRWFTFSGRSDKAPRRAKPR
jgi:hypothetical protein